MNRRNLYFCPEALDVLTPALAAAVRRAFLIIAVCFAGMMSLPTARAQTVINYPNGFAGAGAVVDPIGAATFSGTAIQMTNTTSQATNVWYQDAVNVRAFTTTFTFNIQCPADCGDGLGFIIISTTNPNSPAYWSGGSGGQFSWSSGCTTPSTGDNGCVAINSILVKFDLYNGQTAMPGVNNTGFYSGGEYPQPPNPQYDMSGAGISLQSGDLMSATLAYNGTVLTETLTDTVTNKTYTKTYTANIPALVGGDTAIVGFGAGTGAASMNAFLDSWTYTEETPAQASLPSFAPAAGTYTGSQSIALLSASPAAVICYNTAGSPATDGGAGCATGTLYSAPITVAASETLYAVAGGTGYDDSPVASANYVIQTAVTTPTFSPAGGTYTSAQSVIISDAVSNATIYYTTDGTTPTTSSTKYNGPITVTQSETLKAIAVATGDANSAVASAAYTINLMPVVSTPVFSPVGGAYTTAQMVTITDSTTGATIYYTTDGSVPSTASTQYAGPIEVTSTGTVRAIAAATGDTNSAVATANYTISAVPVVATPTFQPSPGVYATAQTVTISESTAGATIYYTTDGSTPTTSSMPYSSAIAVSATETLQAIAVLTGQNNSSVATGVYTISAEPVVATPTFSPAPGAYTTPQTVTIFETTGGASIFYTTDGTMPTTSSTQYTGPITVSATETVEAIGVAAGDTNSAVASASYTIHSALPAVATPVFSPVAGTYTSAQTVTITDATSGATIYYTTDGSIPTTLSKVYSGSIQVSATETVQAIAAATGDSNSAVASAVYTIAPPPSFTLSASPATLTANTSGVGTTTLTVTPVNAFYGAVSFACSGLPNGATCAFSPSTVTPSGAAATTQLTITAPVQSSLAPSGTRPWLPVVTLALTVGLFGWRRGRGRAPWLLLALAFAGAGFLFGCGGGGGNGTTSQNPPPTTSVVTVTATSGSLNATATVTITVD